MLKTSISILLSASLMLLQTSVLSSQVSHSDNSFYTTHIIQKTEIIEDPIVLRSLEELIEDALMHSPLLKLHQNNLEILSEEEYMEKSRWTDFLKVGGRYDYGSGNFVRVVENLGDEIYNQSNRVNHFYTVGLNAQIPLSTFVHGKSRRKIVQERAENEILNVRNTERRIREIVTTHYNSLKKNIDLLEIRAEDLEFHSLSVQVSEEYFREGKLDIEAYTKAIRARTQSAELFQEARYEATLALQMLKELVGIYPG